ncbi:hypothetical protein [Paenibacillus sp. FSL A5-0031]|uniref:hypothetical protein n=1 Tax=Paenibacillus sp. FSL A5-0031 TaxID=1920420 RepID=UPI0015C336C8|nr:hypothetical protein [Paenibacillus sp. FSL A5-0031]
MDIQASLNEDNKENTENGAPHDKDKAAGHRHNGKCCNCSKSSCQDKTKAESPHDK